jgi:hypothetical protein
MAAGLPGSAADRACHVSQFGTIGNPHRIVQWRRQNQVLNW